jgi:hypothetical protein
MTAPITEIARYLTEVDKLYRAGNATGQYTGFKKILIHNLEVDEFAGIYAQTLAYGLFAARLNQKDASQFTRYLAPR